MSDARPTRAELLVTAGAVAAGLAVPGLARAAGVGNRDRAAAVFLLSLEHLSAAFYSEAERVGALTGPRLAAAVELGAVERAHVRAYRALLGSRAAAQPRFDFRGTTESDATFARAAVAIEDLTVAGYAAQLPRLRSPELLQAAMGVHSVEARHAAQVRILAGVAPAAYALDEPQDRAEVRRALAATRIAVRRPPRTDAHSDPTFTR
jgi:hypothetical protein